MIRNLILDWSGTLVDDLPAVWQASNFVFRQAGVKELTLNEFRAAFRLPFKHFYDHYIPHISLAQLEGWFHDAFREVQDSVVELPHARDFLEFSRGKGLRIFILSTVHRDHFQRQAGRLGFDRYVEVPYLGIWDKRRKIGEVLAGHDLRREETLFVGDMQHDIEAAREGEVYACAVLTGYNRLDQLRASRPDLIVEHLSELRSVLEKNQMDLNRRNLSAEVRDTPVATVGALIFNEADEVLMIQTHKWSHLWGIPGGKIQRGETAEAALRREVREETNLEVGNVEFVMVQDCIDSSEFYRPAHFLLLNYTARCTESSEVKLNDEAQQYRWVNVSTALRMPLNEPTRTMVETVLAGRQTCKPGAEHG